MLIYIFPSIFPVSLTQSIFHYLENCFLLKSAQQTWANTCQGLLLDHKCNYSQYSHQGIVLLFIIFHKKYLLPITLNYPCHHALYIQKSMILSLKRLLKPNTVNQLNSGQQLVQHTITFQFHFPMEKPLQLVCLFQYCYKQSGIQGLISNKSPFFCFFFTCLQFPTAAICLSTISPYIHKPGLQPTYDSLRN